MKGAPPRVEGRVEPGFEPVREAFEESFLKRGEVGAAVSVFHRGQPVVELVGGWADPEDRRPWTPETTSVLFSATKGLVATAFLLLADRGQIDLDAPVSTWWPAFERPGLRRIDVRMLLNHRAGLPVIDAPLALEDFRPPAARVREALEAQPPVRAPGTEQAYGATAWGAYTAVLFEQVTGERLGTFLQREVVDPLGIPLWLGLPRDAAVDRARLLPVDRPTILTEQLPEALTRGSPEARLFRRVALRALGVPTLAGRALLNPTLGPRRFRALWEPAVLELELPWMNAVGSAHALAKVYAALLTEVDGVRLVRPETVEPLRRRQSWSARDPVMQKPLGFAQGFVKELPGVFSPSVDSFGHPGAGGVVGWADPDAELTFAYVMNRMDWRIRSPRALALAQALGNCG